MIAFRNISKRYGRLMVLQKVTLAIEPGRVTAILGPNGSGKTTLLKCFLGLVKPDEGEIVAFDERINSHPDYRHRVGYMPQIARFPEHLTVKEIIQMVKDLRRQPLRDYDEELFEQFRLEREVDKKSKELSGGNRQKLNAYLAFLFQPDIYILDEPTAGLDPYASLVLKQKVLEERNRGKTVILTSHILSEVAEMADDIVFLLDGKVVLKEPKQQLLLRTQAQSLEEVMATLLTKADI